MLTSVTEAPSRTATLGGGIEAYAVLRFQDLEQARLAIAAVQGVLDSPLGAAFRRGGLEARILRDLEDWQPVLYFSAGARAAARMAGTRLPDSDGTMHADASRHTSVLAPPEPATQDATSATITKLKVLVVEDQLDTATMLAALLTTWGYEVEVAHTGADALRMAGDFHPRVVLLDLGLPDQHGYRLARRLRDETGPQPMSFVVVTGWSQRVDQELSAAAGISHHLVKPVNPDALHSILDRYQAAISH